MNFVAFGEDVHASGVDVDEDVVGGVEAVEVCVCVGATALEVFAADEAGVDVDVGEGDGAEFLEVKVEEEAARGLEIEGKLVEGREAGEGASYRFMVSRYKSEYPLGGPAPRSRASPFLLATAPLSIFSFSVSSSSDSPSSSTSCPSSRCAIAPFTSPPFVFRSSSSIPSSTLARFKRGDPRGAASRVSPESLVGRLVAICAVYAVRIAW